MTITFRECIEEIKKIKLDSIRNDEPDYFECVTQTESVQQLTGVLESCFGPVLKPQNASPSGRAKQISAPYGGIRNDQTLFYLEDQTHNYCAMLWPWGNGKLVTLKMFINPK